MFNCFISVVGLIHSDKHLLKEYIINAYKTLKNNFADFEIIIVNNRVIPDVRDVIRDINRDILKSVITINLSRKVDLNNAIIAGLDRANGDYTVALDMDFSKNPDIIVDLYRKTQRNIDIVYLKYKKRKISLLHFIFFKIFYFIINNYSDIKIDIETHWNCIISRRALNSLLKIRERMRYMKGIYSLIGYNQDFLEVDIPQSMSKQKFSELFKTAIVAIFSFTDVINRLLIGIFILSIIFCIGISSNALMVKLFGYDIFGTPQHQVPGWTFLVIFLSIMFALLFFVLYLFSIYLNNINNEIKQRPLYIIESIQRF